MKRFMIAYIRIIDNFSDKMGFVAMYLVFIMIAILFYASISKTFFTPSLWTLEMAQFVMVAYFLLGGAYSLKQNAHVRMDLLYDRLSPRLKTILDSLTIICLIVYLLVLFIGGVASAYYAFVYGETSYSAWAPKMLPIKIIMNIGILATLLQAFSIWFKDILKLTDTPPLQAKDSVK